MEPINNSEVMALVDLAFADIRRGELKGIEFLMLKAIGTALPSPRAKQYKQFLSTRDIVACAGIKKSAFYDHRKALVANGYLCFEKGPRQENGKDGLTNYWLGPKLLRLLDSLSLGCVRETDTVGIDIHDPYLSENETSREDIPSVFSVRETDRVEIKESPKVETDEDSSANVRGMNRNRQVDKLLAKPAPEPELPQDDWYSRFGNPEANVIGAGRGKPRSSRIAAPEVAREPTQEQLEYEAWKATRSCR